MPPSTFPPEGCTRIRASASTRTPPAQTSYSKPTNAHLGDLTTLMTRLRDAARDPEGAPATSAAPSMTTRVLTQCAHFVPNAAVVDPPPSSSPPSAPLPPAPPTAVAARPNRVVTWLVTNAAMCSRSAFRLSTAAI